MGSGGGCVECPRGLSSGPSFVADLLCDLDNYLSFSESNALPEMRVRCKDV